MSSDVLRKCTEQLPAGFLRDNEAVFTHPWQAQAFALAVSLIDSGRISWSEWAEALGYEIAHAADQGLAEDGSDYYELWLRALEGLVARKGLVSSQELGELGNAWRKAYQNTPHGRPVSL